jgi:hypothetical protein
MEYWRNGLMGLGEPGATLQLFLSTTPVLQYSTTPILYGRAIWIVTEN